MPPRSIFRRGRVGVRVSAFAFASVHVCDVGVLRVSPPCPQLKNGYLPSLRRPLLPSRHRGPFDSVCVCSLPHRRCWRFRMCVRDVCVGRFRFAIVLGRVKHEADGVSVLFVWVMHPCMSRRETGLVLHPSPNYGACSSVAVGSSPEAKPWHAAVLSVQRSLLWFAPAGHIPCTPTPAPSLLWVCLVAVFFFFLEVLAKPSLPAFAFLCT